MNTENLVYVPKAVRTAANYPEGEPFQNQLPNWKGKRVEDGPNKGLLYGAYEFLSPQDARTLGAKNIRPKQDKDGDVMHLVADWPQHYFSK